MISLPCRQAKWTKCLVEPESMFMFRSRRTTLVKRLWKARVRKDETEGQTEALRLAKKLKEQQLEMLVAAVESRGGSSDCVLVEGEALHLLSCRTWRWPDLDHDRQLKRIPSCSSDDCCNPYHWSRLCLPGERDTCYATRPNIRRLSGGASLPPTCC